jgi:hypothetical protein
MNNKNMKKAMIVVALVAVWFGCKTAYQRYNFKPAEGSIEISFSINDPLRYPDDEPLEEPQTVAWLEDADGKYVRSILVSDWTSGGGWAKKIKLPDGKKVTASCPQWQVASSWPKNHTKQQIDAVTKATPETGSHKISVDCRKANLPAGTYQYFVQASVAPLHSIVCTGKITIGGQQEESIAKVIYKPEIHKDAGPILSDVKARYTP